VDIFPISLKLQQQPCLIVGGGRIAYRKAVLLAKAGAVIDVIAPEIETDLLEIVRASQGQYVQASFSPDIPLRPYRLVIAASFGGFDCHQWQITSFIPSNSYPTGSQYSAWHGQAGRVFWKMACRSKSQN